MSQRGEHFGFAAVDSAVSARGLYHGGLAATQEGVDRSFLRDGTWHGWQAIGALRFAPAGVGRKVLILRFHRACELQMAKFIDGADMIGVVVGH